MNTHAANRWVAVVCGSALTALALAPLPGSSLTRSARADAGDATGSCDAADLDGTYVVSLNGFTTANRQPDALGTISNFAPVMEIGTFTFDGAGAVSRAVTVAVGGLRFPVKDVGTYATNADCSGSIAFPTNSDTFSFNAVGRDSIAIVPMTPNQSGAGTLSKQRIRDCRTETFFGTYVYSINAFGTFLPAPPPYPYAMDSFFPVSVVGTWVFDGKGGVTRSLSLSFDGYISPYADKGTYKVSPDCTMSAYFPSDNEPFQIIAVNARTFVQGVAAPGAVGAGTLIKRSLDID
jgi:hypothetical protein